jgi:Na+/proline symporter
MSTLGLSSSAAPHVADHVITRIQIDRSCKQAALGYYASAVFWLLFGTAAALISSIKLTIRSSLEVGNGSPLDVFDRCI